VAAGLGVGETAQRPDRRTPAFAIRGQDKVPVSHQETVVSGQRSALIEIKISVVHRLFVAIGIPPELRLALAKLCEGVPSARWVAPENFHLTLRFIGPVDDPTEERIAAALHQIEAAPFELVLSGVGQFSGHTIWAGVEPNPALVELQSHVEQELQHAGVSADARPFRPHVKLGRSPRRIRFRPYLEEHGSFRAEPFAVCEFSLIESRRGREGAVYEHLADYGLAA
jgi:2'-5' RNA ligase